MRGDTAPCRIHSRVLIIIHENEDTPSVKAAVPVEVVKTVGVRHKQIAAYQETGTARQGFVRDPIVYQNPTDLASELIVLTIWREVPHLFKVWGTEDSLCVPLKFRDVFYLLRSLNEWVVKDAFWDNDIVGEPAVVIGEGVCETKDGT